MRATQIRFQLRPRPNKNELKAAPQRGKLPRVAEVLALAISFDDMIRRGIASDYTDLARLGCISKERVSQMMRLIWLAPDIQQELLTLQPTPSGRFFAGETALRRIAERMLWAEQRLAWAQLQKDADSTCYSPEPE